MTGPGLGESRPTAQLLQPLRRERLALEAVLDIAFHGRAKPVRSEALARRHKLPRRSLEQTLQKLVRAGLLKSGRGPSGGYVLARERRRITAGDVLRAAFRPLDGDEQPNAASRLGSVVLDPLWGEVADAVLDRLDRVNLEQLCRQARRSGFRPDEEGVQDFTI